MFTLLFKRILFGHVTYEFDDVRRLLCGQSSVGRPLPPVLGPGEDILQRGQRQRPTHGGHADLAQTRSRLQFEMTFFDTCVPYNHNIAATIYPQVLLDLDDLPGECRLNVHVELDVGRLGRRRLLVSREL